MNKMLVLVGAVVISGVVNAGERESGFYVGGTVGSMSFDADEAVNTSVDIDDSAAVGAIFGYEFGGGFSAELQTNYAQPDARVDTENYILEGDFDYYTTAIYGVWRSPGKVYFKGKLGYAYQEAETEVDGYYDDYDLEWDDSGASYGIGVGVTVIDHLMIEAEYTVNSSDELDTDVISASVAWHF